MYVGLEGTYLLFNMAQILEKFDTCVHLPLFKPTQNNQSQNIRPAENIKLICDWLQQSATSNHRFFKLHF